MQADLVFSNLLQPQRAARLQDSNNRNWNFFTVLQLVSTRLFESKIKDRKLATLLAYERRNWVDKLIQLHENESARQDVRDSTLNILYSLQKQMPANTPFADMKSMRKLLDEHLDRSQTTSTNSTKPIAAPPGSPIGS